MTLRQLRDEIDTEELVSWRAYEGIHGFGTQRLLACLCLHGHAISAGVGVKISPEDLYPRFRTDEERANIERQRLEAWAIANGGS